MTGDDYVANWMATLGWENSTDCDDVLDNLDYLDEINIEYTPRLDKVFRPYSYFSWPNTRVVILGEKPYGFVGHNTGLSYSVPIGCTNAPYASKNILEELELDMGVYREHGCFDGWAKQGVLLLNCSLTRCVGDVDHDVGWSSLIDETVRFLSAQSLGIAFVLWGKEAKKQLVNLDTTNHLVLTGANPTGDERGFIGSRPFSKINNYLVGCGFDPIDWGA